jgi:para-aminobenzoate synthetase component 1
VQRITASFPVTNKEIFKQQMLNWANQFGICCFLDNNQYKDGHHSYEWLLAAEAVSVFEAQPDNIFSSLRNFCDKNNDWLFGHLGYDLKNEIEALTSLHRDSIGFPDLFLFRPAIVIRSNEEGIIISSLTQQPLEIYNNILSSAGVAESLPQTLSIQSRVSKESYINTVEKLRAHILRGDCYEINYCVEFFAEKATIDPLTVYLQLIQISPNPFSNKINITAKRNEIIEVNLFDVTSRKISNQSFTNSTSINTEQLTKGIYLYEVRIKNGVIKKGKVVKD